MSEQEKPITCSLRSGEYHDMVRELDELQARLAAAEARAEQEHARCERLAAYAIAMRQYDKQLISQKQTAETWHLYRLYEKARAALQPGDL